MKNFLVVMLLVSASILILGGFMTWMPGERFAGPAPAASEEESDLADRLRGHVEVLAREIGPRGAHAPGSLDAAETYLENQLRRFGLEVETVDAPVRGVPQTILVGQMTGFRAKDEVVVFGAYYDSETRSPGSNANASGCAALLEVARALSAGGSERTIRFVFFPGGAGMAAGTAERGSSVYAARCRERGEKVVAMLALDSLGAYSTRPKSQSVPFPLGPVYPDTGDFVCFVGDLSSRGLVAKCTELFRKGARFGAHGAALPSFLPSIGTGDDAAFREHGYPAVRVTDTGTLRHEHNGRISDTPDRLDYASAARVTAGLARVGAELARRTNGVL